MFIIPRKISRTALVYQRYAELFLVNSIKVNHMEHSEIKKMSNSELTESSKKVMIEFLKFRQKFPPNHVISIKSNNMLICMKELIGRLNQEK